MLQITQNEIRQLPPKEQAKLLVWSNDIPVVESNRRKRIAAEMRKEELGGVNNDDLETA